MIAEQAPRRFVRLVVVGVFFCLTAWLGRPAHAQSAEVAPTQTPAQGDAAARFRRGVELYDEGDAASALVEFRRAYDIAPDYRVLYNIGQAHYELRDYAASFSAFQRYLAEGGERVAAARREQVEGDLARLQQRVAKVAVKVDVSGARITIDDVAVATSPVPTPIVVNLGRRRIKAQLGAREAARTIEIAGGDAAEVVLELGSERQTASNTKRTLGWVAAGTGAALLGTALVMDLILVPNALDDFEAQRARDAPTATAAQSNVHTLQVLTVVGYAGGAVLGGVGAALLLWPERAASAPTSAASPASAQFQLQLRGTGVIATTKF